MAAMGMPEVVVAEAMYRNGKQSYSIFSQDRMDNVRLEERDISQMCMFCDLEFIRYKCWMFLVNTVISTREQEFW